MSLKMFPGLEEATEDKNLAIGRAVVDYALKEETGHPGFVGYMLFRAQEGVSIGRLARNNHVNLGVTFIMGKNRSKSAFCESWKLV